MTLVLSRAELERIREEAKIDNSTKFNPEKQRKLELKKKSQDRVQNWPNTLEALRKKKESFLKDRADEEEQKRQEIDRQEAEVRKNQRLESIRRANDLLYEQTDKMKLLRSQILYADVVHERVSQAKEKHAVKEVEKVESAKFHEEILRKVREGEEIEKKKIEAQQQKIEEVKLSRFEQREEARKIREEIARKNREDGERMKAEIKRRAEEELRDYENKQRLAAESNARMIKANEDLKVIRLEMREKEKIAEAERDAEVEKIDHRKKMLKHLEQVRFEKAQQTRQKIIDAAVEQLAKKTNTEQAILDKQMQDIQDKEDRLLAHKAAVMEKQKRDILAQREEQMQARDIKMRREHEEELAMLERQRLENEAAIQREKDKEIRAREETARIKQLQWNEARDRARKKEEEKLIEIEQARFLSSIDNNDDARFVELCKAEIEHNVRLGKPIYTLLRALEYAQPVLIPAKLDKEKNKRHE